MSSAWAIHAFNTVDEFGCFAFGLKGGTWLQHRLNATARTTKDVDGLICGDIDAFLTALDGPLAEPWGPLTLRRGPVEVINTPTRVIQQRRFDLILALRGVTWRRIQFEISPNEAGIGDTFEAVEPAPLDRFGLDGIHLKVRLDQDKICLLVMLGVRADGHKELIALSDGFRESSESWADLLRDCKRRGMRAPALAVAGQLFGATILARGMATCSSCSVNTFTGQAGSTHSQVRFRHRSSTGRPNDGASTSRTVRRP